MRKADEAAREAPFLRMAMAVGSTPQEQSGNGTPMRAALTTVPSERPERWRANVSRDTNAWSNPAIKNPNKIYGDISLSIYKRESIKFIVTMFC